MSGLIEAQDAEAKFEAVQAQLLNDLIDRINQEIVRNFSKTQIIRISVKISDNFRPEILQLFNTSKDWNLVICQGDSISIRYKEQG